MAAKIIDGIAFANQVKQDVAARTAQLKASGHAVHLTAILVGVTPGAELYALRPAPLALPLAALAFLSAWAAAIHLTGGEKYDDHPWI